MKRKGLVVSCSYPQSDHALDAPENDVQFYEHILRSFGFTVRRLSDFKLGLQSSHRGNILRSLEWLVQDAQPGDNLAFVFAGHGLCTTRTTSDRRDELDRAFLAAELEDPFPANLLFDAELQSIFALLPAGVLLTCIVDAPCGDTVVRLPWFYDGKTGSFCGPPCARHSSLWQGDRHPRRERGAPNNLHFTIRGAPSSLAKAGTAKPKCVGPCDLFPGVAAFLICACRPDHVCLEAQLPAGNQSYGLLTTSFAAALQQAMRSANIAGLGQGLHKGVDEADEAPQCPISYLELARMIEDDLQKRVNKVVAGRPGLEQHVLLGFSQDPSTCTFLHPPEQVCGIARPLPPPGGRLPASVLANLISGSGGDPRWPNVLVQLCRIDREEIPPQDRVPTASGQLHPLASSLLSAEVLGEFWLPPLAHIFPEAVLPGDPPTPPKPATPRPRGAFQSPRSMRAGLKSQRQRKGCYPKSCHIARKELWCRLRAPSLGKQQQYCTWGADLKGNQFQTRELLEASSGDNQCLEPGDKVPTSCGGHSVGLAKLLGGARHPRAVYAQAAQKLRWRGGLLTAVEFEYFSVREIGLDLETARKAFRACLEAQARSQAGLSLVPILQTATSCVESSLLAEALEDCAREEMEDPGFVLEARLELEWRSAVGFGARAAAGELRLFAAELRPRELPKDTLLAQLNAREAELGHGGAVPSPMATLNKLSNSKLTKRLWSRGFSFPADEEATILGGEDNSVFFLRFGLCASRDVYPNAAEVTPRGMLATPRLNAPEASWIVPHIVFVSQALTYARLPPTGTWCVQMPQPEDSAGCLVPVCTCARLCDAQKAAFSLSKPQQADRVEPDQPAEPQKAVAPVPLNTNGYGRYFLQSSSASL